MKQCSKCKIHKPLTDYHVDKRTNKARSYCKPCQGVMNQNYRKANAEKVREQNKINSHNYRLRNTYNIPQEEYNSMLIESNDLCAICNRKKKLYVDHNHNTGLVRGLLCSNCNTGLGMLGDSITVLENAIEYLKQPKVTQSG